MDGGFMHFNVAQSANQQIFTTLQAAMGKLTGAGRSEPPGRALIVS